MLLIFSFSNLAKNAVVSDSLLDFPSNHIVFRSILVLPWKKLERPEPVRGEQFSPLSTTSGDKGAHSFPTDA